MLKKNIIIHIITLSYPFVHTKKLPKPVESFESPNQSTGGSAPLMDLNSVLKEMWKEVIYQWNDLYCCIHRISWK